jgi:hypothetical protein
MMQGTAVPVQLVALVRNVQTRVGVRRTVAVRRPTPLRSAELRSCVGDCARAAQAVRGHRCRCRRLLTLLVQTVALDVVMAVLLLVLQWMTMTRRVL